jgi:hypothetical protein
VDLKETSYTEPSLSLWQSFPFPPCWSSWIKKEWDNRTQKEPISHDQIQAWRVYVISIQHVISCPQILTLHRHTVTTEDIMVVRPFQEAHIPREHAWANVHIWCKKRLISCSIAMRKCSMLMELSELFPQSRVINYFAYICIFISLRSAIGKAKQKQYCCTKQNNASCVSIYLCSVVFPPYTCH